MKECRECGKKLPKVNPTIIEFSKNILERYKKRLKNDGKFMTDEQLKDLNDKITETEIYSNGEYPYDKALCKECEEKVSEVARKNKEGTLEKEDIMIFGENEESKAKRNNQEIKFY